MYTKQLAVLVRLGQNRWLGFYQFQTKSYIRDEITYTEFWRMWKKRHEDYFLLFFFCFSMFSLFAPHKGAQVCKGG